MTIALIAAVFLISFGIAMEVLDVFLNRPLTDFDRNCSRIDQELDDELAARRACRPSGSVNRII